MHEIYQYIVIIVLLLLSGIFSGSETAFFSLDKAKRKDLLYGNRKIPFASRLLKKPDQLLVTLLFSNMLVNIFLANLSEGIITESSFLVGFSVNSKIFIAIIVATSIVLIFGEVLPKVLSINNPLKVIKLLSPAIFIVSYIVYPFKIGLFHFTKLSKKLFSHKNLDDTITDDELAAIVEVGFKEGAIDRDEVFLIQNVLKFAKLEVSSIMTPRTKVFGVDINSSFDKLIYEAKKTGYSKIPIFDQSKDNMKGIIYMRDILPIIRGDEEKPEHLKDFMKNVLYVPEGKSLLALLKEFKEKRIKMAVVIDEYGGTAGIITLDDLIHRITGKFFEEDNEHEGRKVIKLRKNEFLCDGDATLEEFYRVTGIELHDEEQETIAGYLMSKMDLVPKTNDRYIDSGLLFKVSKMNKHIIEKVLIKKMKTKKTKIKKGL